MSIDDSLRRIANQAFFERLNIIEVDTIDAEHGEPFDLLFKPALHADALALERYARENGVNFNPQSLHDRGLNIEHWVGPTGLEPMTSTVECGRLADVLPFARKVA